jgi:hypothetical protein
MKQDLRVLAVAGLLLLATSLGGPALAQKPGGILRMSHFDSPASMSLLEESTAAVNRPMMGVFNNLVMFDQHVPQNSMRSIVPDLATSWAWNEEGTELTFPLRQGVNRHSPDPRRFRARIAPLNGLGNGKSGQCGAKGDRSGPLRTPGRWHALIGRHRRMPLPLSPAAL